MQPRVISLLPGSTEIVAALGLQHYLVGRSHECDHPEEINSLRVCSRPGINVDGTSAEIDVAVKDSISNAVSVFEILEDAIRDAEPTVVITQTQCEVCAVNLSDVQQALGEITGLDPAIVSTRPMALQDLWADIRRIAKALDATREGSQLVSRLQNRLESVRQAASTFTGSPTVACIEWLDPLMSAGNWIPELVEIAGGTPLLSKAGEHSPWLSWEDLIAADPDVIVIIPCGFDLDRTESELHLLTDHPLWNGLRAVSAGRTYFADGHHFFNRPGPRLVESAEILFEILYRPPSDSNHHGIAWKPVRS